VKALCYAILLVMALSTPVSAVSAAPAQGGDVLWAKRDTGGVAIDSEAGPDGSLLYVITRDTVGSHRTIAYRTDTGTVEWEQVGVGEPIGVVVSPDGLKVYALAASLIAYDALTGQLLWDQPDLYPNSQSWVYSVAATNSLVFVGGTLEEQAQGKTAMFVLAFDPPTGDHAWTKYVQGGDFIDLPDSAFIAPSPDGSKLYLTGGLVRTQGHSQDYVTVALDAGTGTPTWLRRYDGGMYDKPFAIALSPDGSNVYVTGHSDSPTGSDGYLTIAYSAETGTVLWGRRYSGGIPDSVTISPDGSKAFVTGWGSNGSTQDIATVAYDAKTGASLWVRRLNPTGSGFNTGFDVAATDAAAFVTGGVSPGASFVTLGYDSATGATLWVRPYTDPDGQFAGGGSVVTSPDGATVFVSDAGSPNSTSIAYSTG
jgi:DNA-binding beta-propeller fold protein YncE